MMPIGYANEWARSISAAAKKARACRDSLGAGERRERGFFLPIHAAPQNWRRLIDSLWNPMPRTRHVTETRRHRISDLHPAAREATPEMFRRDSRARRN
jgi:hypothetical protein